jgi:hypothetical protein
VLSTVERVAKRHTPTCWTTGDLTAVSHAGSIRPIADVFSIRPAADVFDAADPMPRPPLGGSSKLTTPATRAPASSAVNEFQLSFCVMSVCLVDQLINHRGFGAVPLHRFAGAAFAAPAIL